MHVWWVLKGHMKVIVMRFQQNVYSRIRLGIHKSEGHNNLKVLIYIIRKTQWAPEAPSLVAEG